MDARVDSGEGPWPEASLAPIYAAIGVLMAVALAGFAIALWAPASVLSGRGASETRAEHAVFDRKLRFAPDGAPHVMRWM